MRPLVLAFAAGVLLTGPVLAREPDHHPAPAPAAEAAPSHEMCKSVMGRQMDGKPVHDHGRDKTGAPTWPDGKPLNATEMEKMHKACAEKMQKQETAPKEK